MSLIQDLLAKSVAKWGGDDVDEKEQLRKGEFNNNEPNIDLTIEPSDGKLSSSRKRTEKGKSKSDEDQRRKKKVRRDHGVKTDAVQHEDIKKERKTWKAEYSDTETVVDTEHEELSSKVSKRNTVKKCINSVARGLPAMAIGETVEAVCNMQEKEREELIKVLGLEEAVKNAQEEDNATPSSVIDTGEIDSDDEVLVDTPVREDDTNIWVSSDSEGDVQVVGAASNSRGTGSSKRKAGDGLDLSGPRGWGECPVCDQMMPLSKLQLHAMACQGLELNGGSGLEVNPYDVQTKCTVCSNLVPTLVYDEHKQTCWANTDTKRRILTPMERRKAQFPKNKYWGTVPKK